MLTLFFPRRTARKKWEPIEMKKFKGGKKNKTDSNKVSYLAFYRKLGI